MDRQAAGPDCAKMHIIGCRLASTAIGNIAVRKEELASTGSLLQGTCGVRQCPRYCYGGSSIIMRRSPCRPAALHPFGPYLNAFTHNPQVTCSTSTTQQPSRAPAALHTTPTSLLLRSARTSLIGHPPSALGSPLPLSLRSLPRVAIHYCSSLFFSCNPTSSVHPLICRRASLRARM